MMLNSIDVIDLTRPYDHDERHRQIGSAKQLSSR